ARSEARDEAHREVAVVGNEDVPAALERPRRANLAALVPRDGDDERRLALSVEPELRLVAQSRFQHGAEHVEQVLIRKAEVLVATCRLLDACSHDTSPPGRARSRWSAILASASRGSSAGIDRCEPWGALVYSLARNGRRARSSPRGPRDGAEAIVERPGRRPRAPRRAVAP